MATYTVTTGTKSTLWQGGVRVQSGATIVKVTDDNDSNLEFTVGEVIKITFGNGQTHEGNYRGTITIDGVKYPVIQFWTGTFHYAVGTGNPSTAPHHLQPVLNAETFTVCYFPGTLIATPSGERRVENLVAGDLVLIWNSCRSFGAADRANAPQDAGSARAVPIKWIGRQTVSTRFGPADRLMPVRFAAGSLGGGGGNPLPHTDLTVTADHAMLVDGVLCQAEALINGTTITRVPLSELDESYTVYHVETEAHEIILANGSPSETFIDNVSRRAFDNYAEFEALHGAKPPEMQELPYPRASNARHLPGRIKTRLGIVSTRPAKTA